MQQKMPEGHKAQFKAASKQLNKLIVIQ